MPLKLSVKVGQSIAIGGPTTLRIESKSGQEISLVFDADRSIPIRIIPQHSETTTGAPKPRGDNQPVGLGLDDHKSSHGLGRK